jgi:signal transduction histidine kinase
VNSTEFNVALLLSVVIAIPMLLDVAFDAVYVFLPGSGRKLHWFVRVFLLAALTVPSLLLLAPTTFPAGTATVEGYLCVQSFKRLATITCLFGYISHEKADGEGGEGHVKDASRRLGLLSVLTLASYLAYELFWLYAYTAGSGTNQGLSASNPLRATGAFFLVLCAVQVLHIIAIWSWRFVGPHAMALRKACAPVVNALLWRVHRRAAPDEVSRVHSPDDDAPGAGGEGGGGGGGGRSLKAASPDKTLVDLDAFFKGKRPAWTSRDITMALYFAAMVLIPALGLVISKACGNPGINSLTATAREISGYVYLQMAFTTLVFVLPAYLARYELFYAMRALSEKENFIAQVSVEVRNPLNDVLINISSVQNDISALQPNKSNPNSAAEREIYSSVVDTINEIKHSTEVALSTFTDIITVNRLDKGQAKLDKQDTHPWRYFRDVARPFEIEARHKRIGFGMTCLEFNSGWPDEHFVRIDRHKISQVLRTLVLCSFKATPAGGNVHITLAIVDNETGQAHQPHASQTSHHGDGAALGALAPVAALLSHAVGGLFRRGNVAPTIDPASSKTGGSRTNRRNAQTSSQQAGHWLVLELHDTGKALHRREIDGSLLRLRACRAKVEAHKGVMRVFPRPNDRGATFQIRLPMFAFVQPGSQGQSRHSSAMGQSLRVSGGAGGGAGTTVMRRLGKEQRGSRGSDASSQDSDHGMFGMRNDFDVGAPAAQVLSF